MSNHHLRLRTIEVAMTPEDIVLFWLESARNAGGFKEGTFCSPAPRAYIANAVSASVSAATREMDRDAAQQAIRESQQRADSLYLLAITINVAGSECSREANVRSLLMIGYLRTVLQVPKSKRLDVFPFFRTSLLIGFETLIDRRRRNRPGEQRTL
jgi:hypothetical protein